MALVANDPKAAKRLGIPQSVGQDYVEADKGRKFGSGGTTMKESKAMVREEMKYLKRGKAPKRVMEHEAREHESIGMERKMKMAKGGMAADKAGRALMRRTPDTMGRAMVKGYKEGGSVFRRAADGIATKGKTKGKMVKMSYGGKC